MVKLKLGRVVARPRREETMSDIKHPEWLKVSKPQDSIDLFNRGLLPESIARWMLVTGLRHPLRAIYGSNFRAAMALLWLALTDKPRMWWICWKYRDDTSAHQ